MINEGSQQIQNNALQKIRGAIKKKKKKKKFGKNFIQAQKKLLRLEKNTKSCLQLTRFIMAMLAKHPDGARLLIDFAKNKKCILATATPYWKSAENVEKKTKTSSDKEPSKTKEGSTW